MPFSVRRAIDAALSFVSLVIAVAVVYRHYITDASDPYRCRALETSGGWAGKHRGPYGSDKYLQWQPPGCLLHQYGHGEIKACMNDERILFIGDSGTRQIFFSAAKKLDRQKAVALYLTSGRQDDLSFSHGDVNITFVWDPYLNSTTSKDELEHYQHGTQTSTSKRAGVIVVGTGLWQAKNLGPAYLDGFKEAIDRVSSYLPDTSSKDSAVILPPSERNDARNLIFFIPVPTPITSKLDVTRVGSMTPERIQAMNEYLRDAAVDKNIEVLWSYSVMTWLRPSAYEEDGYHVVENVAERFTDVVLNVRCNSVSKLQHYPFDRTCCNAPPPLNIVQRAIILGAVLTSIFSIYSLTRPSRVELSEKPIPSTVKSSPPLSTIQAAAIISAAALYCVIADRSLLLDRLEKLSSEKTFLQMITLVGLGGLLTIRRSEGHMRSVKAVRVPVPSNFLSRDQSEEWKGWMQFVILAYHYTGMSNVLWIYQIVRLLVASYLFMTGYGHTLYFLRTEDFSLRRVMSVLVRVNLLSCVLAYTMRTDYNFYYFPALTTFWFLITYLTVRIRHQPNQVPTRLILKITISAIIVNCLIRQYGILEAIFRVLHALFKIQVDIHELQFRLGLDSVIVYIGMLAATLHLQIIGGLPCSTTCFATFIKRVPTAMHTFAMIASLIALPSYFTAIQSITSKSDYNKFHPWLSPIPVLAFVALRNATQTLRDFHSLLFAWLGRFSLETFILQYHIWLASDTKALLSLGLWTRQVVLDGTLSDTFRWLSEFAIITGIFLWSSEAVARATNILSSLFVNQKGSSAIRDVVKQVTIRKSSNPTREDEKSGKSPAGRVRNASILLEDGVGDIASAISLTDPSRKLETEDNDSALKWRIGSAILVMIVGNWLYF